MKVKIPTRLSALGLLTVVISTQPAHAMDAGNKEAVRQLFDQAVRDFEAGQYQQALGKFQRAYESAKVPKLLLSIAGTHVKLGHWVDAYEAYHQATILKPNDLWVETFNRRLSTRRSGSSTS